MMRRLLAPAALLVALSAPAALAEEPPLALGDVLVAVDRHYPLLEAAEAEREAAIGDLMAAEGRFDTRLVALGDLRPAGYYESYAGEARVEQPTRLWGARLYGGYRIGRGDFPSYDGGRQTDRSGEARIGLEVPLLRGGSIDEPRADIEQAELDLARFAPEIELRRIDFRRQASLVYWEWVAAGLGVGVGERLLAIAEARQQQLEGRVSRGLVPSIDLADNERLIVDRRIRLRGAQRDAQQAAIQLSLFLRDAAGAPVIVAAERLPTDFPLEAEPSGERLARDLQRAAQSHPLLETFELALDRARVDFQLAQNEALPAIDLRLEGSQDYGSPVEGLSSEGSLSRDARGDTEVKALLRFELPVQRREARGRMQSARAKLSRLEIQQRFARDRIGAEIRQAMAELQAAYAQTLEARRNLELARQLEHAEERMLLLGKSNLIDINIRELQAADADRFLIETQAAYFRALAQYTAAAAADSGF